MKNALTVISAVLVCTSCGMSTSFHDDVENFGLSIECGEMIEATFILPVDDEGFVVGAYDRNARPFVPEHMESRTWFWWNQMHSFEGEIVEFPNHIELHFSIPREELCMRDATVYLEDGSEAHAWIDFEVLPLSDNYEMQGNGNLRVFCD